MTPRFSSLTRRLGNRGTSRPLHSFFGAQVRASEPMAAARQQHPEAPRRSQIEPKSLGEFNAIIKSAKPLVPGATRAVLGEGPVGAQVAFVGEQPGDQEDRLGRPFVGPAGQLLDRAMADAGLDRSRVYVTNAVKHFKFEQRFKSSAARGDADHAGRRHRSARSRLATSVCRTRRHSLRHARRWTLWE